MDLPNKSPGTTASERFLKKQCDSTFLTFWSHSNLFKSDGKELCDVLIVFDNQLLLFSDKECKLDSDDKVDWDRWQRKVIDKSANQLHGTNRWLTLRPDEIFLDNKLTHRFPLTTALKGTDTKHFIVVANLNYSLVKGVQPRLKLDTSLKYIPNQSTNALPFLTVGLVENKYGFLHVIDAIGLSHIIHTLDTTNDFVRYLSKRAEFLTDHKVICETEEDLVALYMSDIDQDGHCFPKKPIGSTAIVEPGRWARFSASLEYAAFRASNRVSYAWDALIENFAHFIWRGESYNPEPPDVNSQEILIRKMASIPRLQRREMSRSLLEITGKTNKDRKRSVRMIKGYTDRSKKVYVLMSLSSSIDADGEKYKAKRRAMLEAYCMVAKLLYRDAEEVLGIATSASDDRDMSEDAIYLPCNDWTDEDYKEAKRIQDDLDLMKKKEMNYMHDTEYPIYPGQQVRGKMGPASFPRRADCPCGSKKRYKNCCGRKR